MNVTKALQMLEKIIVNPLNTAINFVVLKIFTSLQELLQNFSQSKQNIAIFDELYHFIVKENAKNE